MKLPAFRPWWAQRAPREKTILRFAALLVAAALLWSVALAPALRTVRAFDAKHAAQEAQLQAMLRLQAQAQGLQAQPRLSPAAATQALQTSVQQAFGPKADLSSNAGNVTVTLRGVSADALALWLANARVEARASPIQARLTRTGDTWSGTLQMGLPAS